MEAPSFLDDEQRAIWQRTYDRVLDDTGDDDKAAMAAFGAIWRSSMGLAVKSRMIPSSVKAIKQAEDGLYVAGWAITFGSPAHRDVDNPSTFFTEETEFLLEYFPRAPLWIEHGATGGYKSWPVGYRVSWQVYEHGLWMVHFIPATTKGYKQLVADITNGEYTYSVDTAKHHMMSGYNPATGEHKFWPMVGCSLTKDPAEPGNGPVIPMSMSSVKSSAARPTKDAEVETYTKKSMDMEEIEMLTEEQVAALAEMLGVDATPEAVHEALGKLHAQLTAQLGEAGPDKMDGEPDETKMDGEDPDETKMDDDEDTPAVKMYADVDPSALKSAFGLDKDADDKDLLAAIANLRDEVIAEPEPAKSLNLAALGRFAQSRQQTAVNRLPANSPAQPAKSRRYGSVRVNTGAKKPGLGDLVMGIVRGNPSEIKAASAGVSRNTAGGYLVRREVADEIIQPLREKTIVMAAGAEIQNMDGIETLTVYKDLDGGDAYWGGEGAEVAQSQPNTGAVNLSLKELVAEYPISNRALRNGPDLEQQLLTNIVSKLRRKADRSFLVGTGAKPNDGGSSGAEPAGLITLLRNVSQVTALGSGNGAKPKFSDFTKLKQKIASRNVEESETWGTAMSPAVGGYMDSLADADGRPLMADNWAGMPYKTLLGFSRYETNGIPSNVTLGTSTDTSYAIMGDWQYCVVGMGMDVEITVDTSVLLRKRQTLIQAVMYIDFGVYFTEAFEALEGVRSNI